MKSVIITGCTRGLGAAMAAGFTNRGWRVLGCGSNPETSASTQKSLGRPHSIVACDLSNPAEIHTMIQNWIAEFGAPELVINNAARMNANAPLWEVSDEEFSNLLNVNVLAVFHICKAVLPAMIKAKRGVIVNFSSGWGRSVSPKVAAYCTTKWAIEGMTRALALDLPEGLAAVPLNPGIIDTEMLRTSFGDEAANFPTPHEWAARAVPCLEKLSAADNGRVMEVP